MYVTKSENGEERKAWCFEEPVFTTPFPLPDLPEPEEPQQPPPPAPYLVTPASRKTGEVGQQCRGAKVAAIGHYLESSGHQVRYQISTVKGMRDLNSFFKLIFLWVIAIWTVM